MKSILLYVICTILIAGFLIQYSQAIAENHEEEIVTEPDEYEEDHPAEIEESGEDQLVEPDEYEEDHPDEIERY